MSTFVASQQDGDDIDHYVMSSEESALYHLYSWKDIIENCFGNKTYYLCSKNESGKVNGVLPLVHLRSILFGNFFVSLPYFNYGGVCADNAVIRERLIFEAIKIVRDLEGEYIEFRQQRPLDNDLRCKTSKVSMALKLTSLPSDLWDGFSSKLRSQIKRSQKAGMEQRIGRHEELDNFYYVFSRNMRDLGTPVYSKTFFSSILKTFPEKSRIISIFYQGIPVASGFLIGFKDKMEIPWASSLRRYNHLSPNMLLYWACLKFSSEQGYGFFDFGRSTPGEGTYRFKEQWGAQPVSLYWHYWLGNRTELPELNPRNPKFQLAITLWKKMPLSITNIIGPQIVKMLP